MESFGTILRNTREEKKLSVETVSRDTTISRNYIEALEDENLSVLPGNTYALGFLRNYSTYLGLDSAYLVKLFNAKILQETAAPESLLHPKKNYTKIFLIAGAVFICVCAGIFALIYYFAVLPAEQQNRNLLAFTTTEHNTYALSAV
ncbi:MAG: helix-turn-helix domain-containing protein, partial [Spirochaetales bacterium]